MLDGRITCGRCRQPGVLIDELFWHDESGERICRVEYPDGLGYPARRDWVDERNYLMFAILGNSCTGSRHLDFYDYNYDADPIEPVAPRRGLPGDVSDEVRAAAGVLGSDGHTHSYLTVRELLGYDWDRTTRHVGLLDTKAHDTAGLAQWTQARLDARGGPYFQHEIEDYFVPRENVADCRQLNWTEPYWRNLPKQFFGALLRMARLAGDDLDSVRCVFWFDN